MNKGILIIISGVALLGALTAQGQSQKDIVSTQAYAWRGDSILQGKYKAYAPCDKKIVSTYKAQPGYYMPVYSEWNLKNDISSYPRLSGSNTLHKAIYNMGLDEMINAVEPDTTLRTGKEWSGVWTRDVSYSIILSMAQLQPEASRISLLKKITPDGRIIQDTGSGGAWPVSTDRMIWVVAAWEIYKATGDKNWIEQIFPVVAKSLADDSKTAIGPDGLVMGETSFIDWREQSYPRWMQTADIYRSEALGTSTVHVAALNAASKMAMLLGKKTLSTEYSKQAEKLSENINKALWMPEKGYYAMYTYGRENQILNPRAETLGLALSILFDVASPMQAAAITENNPTTPYGVAIFYPQIKDQPPYHNNALWPFVASYWALANAKAKNEQGLLEAIGSVYRPAALFATNKENFVLDNGDIATELNSSNMLWSLAGNLAITNRILMGITPEENGIVFSPVVPEALADTRQLSNYPYRGKKLDITVAGWGDSIASLTLNGRQHSPYIADKELKANNVIEIKMANKPFGAKKVNHCGNSKAPLTPTSWLEDNGKTLVWNPIEYSRNYIVIRDGKRIAETRETTFAADEPGEYQVITVDGQGVESFASEPRSNRAVTKIQPSGEKNAMTSAEVSYSPKGEIKGYHGDGFTELDHKSAPLTVKYTADTDGEYIIALRYANGNGPVNTENKCAIRSITIDGKKAGSVVMPHRGSGNWNDWGMTNRVKVNLGKGTHTIGVEMLPEDENMNIKTNHALVDEVQITRTR